MSRGRPVRPKSSSRHLVPAVWSKDVLAQFGQQEDAVAAPARILEVWGHGPSMTPPSADRGHGDGLSDSLGLHKVLHIFRLPSVWLPKHLRGVGARPAASTKIIE